MTTRLLQTPTKATRRVFDAGANRGARRNLPALRDLSRASDRFAIEIAPVDPIPGRAATFAEEARANGLAAAPFESRIEELVRTDEYKGEPIIFNLDRASAIVSALAALENRATTVMIYQIVVLPNGRMLGLRGVIRPEETEVRDSARALFAALAKVSERAGSRAIFGEGADPAHGALEPAIRRWFGAHCKDNLGKTIAGLEPESPPFEVTWDGVESIPLHIVVREGFGEAYAVVETVAEHPQTTIARGQNFVVAEATPEAVRLHESRRRSSDARVVVKGTSTIDEASTLAQAEASPQVVETLRKAPAPIATPVVDAEIVPERTPPRPRTRERDAELAREASLVFATALLSAAQNRAPTPSVRTNELSRVNPIRTTD